MLSAGDVIRLDYTPDLTRAGIAYACRSLPHTYDRMGGSPYERMRRIVAGKGAELAFQRYLKTQRVPFDLHGLTPFTDPDRYDVSIGGRRCDLKTSLLFDKTQIRQARKEASYLLGATALVPVDQAELTTLGDNDLLVFAFITALVTRSQGELKRAQAARLPVYMIHALPESWNQPRRWKSLGRLAFKAEAGQPVILEIGGQGEQRDFQSEQLELLPQSLTGARLDYFSLAYLHVDQVLQGRLAMQSSSLVRARILQPGDWGNIWVYGMDIYLAGYMARSDFLRQARFLPPDSQVLQYNRTRVPNLSVPVSSLYPLGDLFERARLWSGSNQV